MLRGKVKICDFVVRFKSYTKSHLKRALYCVLGGPGSEKVQEEEHEAVQ